MSLPSDHDRRLQSARVALEGLSIGDAFGQQFFAGLPLEIATRKPPLGPWRYTDDTEMALAIFEVLRDCGTIDQDLLAKSFARRYQLESDRGYGAGARMVLQDIADGIPWYESARQLFGGQGSLGNGAAMRVAPIGAYFADDLGQVVEQASASAEITHLHPEARAGAIAVALAVAWACRERRPANCGRELMKFVAENTPPSAVRSGIEQAQSIPLDEWEFDAANRLGNGSQITAADTIPFCLWCAAAHLHSYEEALWATVRVGGDVDTNAAIVGGIVAMVVGRDELPPEWLRCREELFFLK